MQWNKYYQEKNRLVYQLVVLIVILTTTLSCNSILSDESDSAFLESDIQDVSSLENNRPVRFLPNYNEELNRIIYELNIDIQPNAKDAFITAHVTYQNTVNKSINHIVSIIDIETILIASRISTFQVFDNQGDLYFEWDVFDNYHLINVTLREAIDFNDYYTFSISYLLENSIISNQEATDSYIFQWSIFNDEDVDQFAVVVTLPNDFSLYNNTLAASLDPEADYISVDERRFEWSFYNILKDEVLSWIVRFQPFENPIIPTYKIPAYIWILMAVVFILGTILGSSVVFLIFKSRTDSERKDIVETLLSQPEKDILKIIKDEGGVTTQSKICSLSGFSKAKVSYYITELDQKSIISRERWGRMNRIRIVDDSFEKVYFDDVHEDTTDT